MLKEKGGSPLETESVAVLDGARFALRDHDEVAVFFDFLDDLRFLLAVVTATRFDRDNSHCVLLLLDPTDFAEQYDKSANDRASAKF